MIRAMVMACRCREGPDRWPVGTLSKLACYHHHFNHFAMGRPRVRLYGRSPEHHDFFD